MDLVDFGDGAGQGGRRAQGGRVNPGGMGSECDQDALYGITE